MGHRARVDPASTGSEPDAGFSRHGNRAFEFREADAFDGGAGSHLLADRLRPGERFASHRVTRRNAPPSGSSRLSELQIGRVAAFAFRLRAIARHGVVGPWLPPVRGALGGPGEIRRTGKMRQCPGAVVVDVAYESKLATGRQNTSHSRYDGILHEPALPVPPLRPWVGMDKVDAC